MDEQLRRLERTAPEDPLALLRWVRARRRAGEVPAIQPCAASGVRGRLLAVLLRAGLAGRREIDLLRAAKVPERHVGKRIGDLRALLRGERRPWSVVAFWAPLLQAVELADLALVAEVRPPRPRPEPLDPPPPPVPEGPCCGTCRHRLWAIGAGLGVRCKNADSPLGEGGLVPWLGYCCPEFEPRTG